MSPGPIVFLGDAGIDQYLDPDDERMGGCALNAATAAHAAGACAQLVTAVGSDADGMRVMSYARGVGDEFSKGVKLLSGSTPRQKILLTADGERQLCGYAPGVLSDWRPDAAQRGQIATADVILTVAFAQIIPLFEHLLTLEHRGRLFVDFMDMSDFGGEFARIEPYWAAIDGAFFGLAPGFDHAALQRPGKLVVVTLGAQGSIGYQHGRTYRCAAAPVTRLVDTTGAGDCYAGTLLAHLGARAPLPDAMRAASAAAAVAISRKGAI